MSAHVFRAGALRGRIRVAGDKSISHRALMLGAMAYGSTSIEQPNRGADVSATRNAVIALGAHVVEHETGFIVRGGRVSSPALPIDARNSGTTTRLLMGLCAGAGVTVTFDGDASLRRRPMERIARPLRSIGADVTTTDGRLPATVRGIVGPPGGEFALEIPSAQIKSAILLAHLGATGIVRIRGDRGSRDHTERMLRHFGRTIAFDGTTIELQPGRLEPRRVRVPGDLSAAAFFLAAAAMTPGSDLVVEEVGINPTRAGVLEALILMGAQVECRNQRDLDGEPVADVRVRSAKLHAIELDGDMVVRSIDEIPILAVVAAHADGTTRIRGAGELRAKESDRLAALAQTLAACGVPVTEYPDGLDITGGNALIPGLPLPTFDDHRIAMAIAALAAPTGAHAVAETASIAVSFPEFIERWEAAQRAS
ncbi:MAG: 3-phosphoshikimate 1-carboxyvinyltransferase [Vulcanimicrobiaceae bacterium]